MLKDANAIWNYCKDPLLSKFTQNIPFPYTKKHAFSFIDICDKKWKERRVFNYSIFVKEKLVGNINLALRTEGIAELGYWIGKKHWGKGYCTEASELILEFGFSKLRLHKIYATHIRENIGSGKVMQKLGMTLEGCFKEHVKRRGKWYDLVQYGILRVRR